MAVDTSRAHVEWARSANIDEVNVRQYTAQGSFAAFEPHLPRLRATPVEVLPCSSRHIFAFRRAANGSAVTVVLNLSDAARSVKLDDAAPELRLQPCSWWLDGRR